MNAYPKRKRMHRTLKDNTFLVLYNKSLRKGYEITWAGIKQMIDKAESPLYFRWAWKMWFRRAYNRMNWQSMDMIFASFLPWEEQV